MNAIRSFNVITLTLILVLAGCFGASDGTVSAEEGSELNSPPVLDATSYSQDVECTTTSCSIDVYHAAVDPDGDSFDLGWDLDLDGVVDVQLNNNRGIETLQIPIAYFVSVITDEYIGSSEGECQVTTIALLAEDSNGATSGFLHTLIISCEGGHLDTYTWNDNDANGATAMSDATDDALIEVTMASGSALNWAVVKVSISVDGGTPQACSDEGTCSFTTFESGNDKAWEAGEGITIMENGQDLCNGDNGGCSIQVTITKKGIGSEVDMVIGTRTGYADALQ